MDLLSTSQLSSGDLARLPTAAEKAALDGANPPLSGSNVVVGSSQLGPQLTADQAAALAGATPALSGSNVVVGSSQLGPQLTANQAAALAGASPALSASNVVVGALELPSMAFGSSATGSQVEWNTGRTDLNGTNFYARLLYFPATGPTELISGSITPSDPVVTFPGTFAGGGQAVAFLFKSPPGSLTFIP